MYPYKLYMFICEDDITDWVDTQKGLLITRRKMNMATFNLKMVTKHMYVCLTGYNGILSTFFEKMLPVITNCRNITVLIIESDVVHLKKEWLDNHKIWSVYTWNKPFYHIKLNGLPIGLNKNRQLGSLQSWLLVNPTVHNENVIMTKSKLLCLNCSLETNNQRGDLKALVEKEWKGFCDVLPFIPPKRSYIIPSYIEGELMIKESDPKCYDLWKPYKYILSPPGAGIDCHRTWEAIICNVVPIVLSSTLDSLFVDLPVLIVKKWEDINEKMLLENYTIIQNMKKSGEYNMDKIKMKYWIQDIQKTVNILPNIYFITYGDKKYKESKERLIREIKESNMFDVIKAYGPNDLPRQKSDDYNNVLSRPRGGGYWLWKPHVLHEQFKKMKDGDYLLYLDAGCKFNKYGINRFYEYMDLLASSNYGVLSFQMHDQLEKYWTTREIFEHFGLDPDGKEANAGQFVGGVFMIKKNKHSSAYVEKLYQNSINHPYLYTDDHNKNGRQNPWFKDNRHDQSMTSLLMKTHGTVVIPTDESFKVPFGTGISLDYPFWAARIRK